MFVPPQDIVPPVADTLQLDTHLLPAQVHIALQPPTIFYFHVDSSLAELHRQGVPADTTGAARTVHHPSLVRNTGYRPVTGAPAPLRTDSIPIGFAGALVLLLLGLIAALKRLVPRKSGQYLVALFSHKQFMKFMTEEEPTWLPPMPVFLISASVLIGGTATLVFLQTGMFSHPLIYVAAGMGLIAAMIVLPVLRAAAVEVLGAIFRIRDYTRLHANFSYQSLVFMALLLLPVFLAAALGWLPDLQWAAQALAACFAMTLLYHFLRLLWQMRSERWISLFYFFLYFCSLEILPLLLVYKVIKP